jgi:hypothetical protein
MKFAVFVLALVMIYVGLIPFKVYQLWDALNGKGAK